MDNSIWRELLLDWIDQTSLLPVNGNKQRMRLEDTDISSFFTGFRRLVDPDNSSSNIPEFLKANYPDFELSSSPVKNNETLPHHDYLFIYTMFLHYGCVIRFNQDIQRASQGLTASEQLAVTVFLNYFLSRNVIITRASLMAGIREAIQAMHSGPLAKFYAADENGNRGGDSFTPKKTVKLEQNCREIYKLRGQVDTVGFELSYLEGLVKEKEEQIVGLKRQEGEHLQEIAELKKTVMYERDDEQRSEELGRKEKLELKTLRKNNCLLEDKVANLLIELNNATNDNSKMMAKLKGMGKEVKSYKERTSELAQLIEEYHSDIAAKNQQISELVDTNMELEAFISENRSLLNKNIDSMNTSVSSSSPNASSSSIRSGNLGSCVIDIQLKDKERENEELKAQINSLNDTSMGLCSGIDRFLEENPDFKEKTDLKDICNASQIAPDKIPEFFQALSQVVKEKNQLENTVQGQITVLLKFREDRDRLKEELTVQLEKCATMERELKDLRETVKTYAENERKSLDTVKYEVKHLQEMNSVLKLEKQTFKSGIEKGEEDMYAMIRKNGKLNVIIEKLRFEKKKVENEANEMEGNLNRQLEDARGRQMQLERKIAEQETQLEHRQKRIDFLEEQRGQIEQRFDELRLKKEEGERKCADREDSCRREMNILREVVQKLEAEIVELKRDNANLETKIRIVSNNLRPSLSLDVDRTRVLDPDTEARQSIQARRSSLLNHMTSTPRLSMRQKVRLDMELMKRRRISLLSPDGLTSSESDNAASGEKCVCMPGGAEGQQLKPRVRVTRRDSLIFNSPYCKKRTSVTRSNRSSSKAAYDRTAINQKQKLKRQKNFNKARTALRMSEAGHLDSLLWDDEYDMADLVESGQEGGEFEINNEEIQRNFNEVLQTERCDGEDLFAEVVTPPGIVVLKTAEEDKDRDEDEEEEKERSATITPFMRSFDKSGASTIQSKSYSMNSGVYWGNERIPTPGIVHFSPRSEAVTMSPQRSRILGNCDLNLIPLSQQNLLQLIVIVLIGIFVCIFYQNIVY